MVDHSAIPDDVWEQFGQLDPANSIFEKIWTDKNGIHAHIRYPVTSQQKQAQIVKALKSITKVLDKDVKKDG